MQRPIILGSKVHQAAAHNYRTGVLGEVMQDVGYELPRILLRRSSVNRGRGYECGVLPRPLPGRGNHMVTHLRWTAHLPGGYFLANFRELHIFSEKDKP
jgi:hypothetical protein